MNAGSETVRTTSTTQSCCTTSEREHAATTHTTSRSGQKVMVVRPRALRHKAICCKDQRMVGKETTCCFHDSSDHQLFVMERAQRDLLRCSQRQKTSKDRISSQEKDLARETRRVNRR